MNLSHSLSILLALGITANASNVERKLTDRESILEHRRLLNLGSHLQKIELPDWRELEEEGQEIHVTELQIREQYTSDVDDATLAKLNEIQPVSLDCRPDSCKESLNSKCQNCEMTYCMTNIDKVSEFPLDFNFFTDVVDTEHCNAQSSSFDANEIYDELTAYDATNSDCRSLPVEMAIFESGPGTLTERLTSVLAGIDPGNLVFSNAQPFYEALMMCSDKRKELLRDEACSRENVVQLLRQTAYLMCRTCDPTYDRCVLKLWADASQEIETFEQAFPDAETLFIYTDPTVMLSAAIDAAHVERAACALQRFNPTKNLLEAARKLGKTVADLSTEELCALEARTNMESALAEKQNGGKTVFIHADDAVDTLETIWNDKFVEQTTSLVKGTLGFLSKTVTNVVSNVVEFTGILDVAEYLDTKLKLLSLVTENMKAAAGEYLDDVYADVENLSGYNR